MPHLITLSLMHTLYKEQPFSTFLNITTFERSFLRLFIITFIMCAQGFSEGTTFTKQFVYRGECRDFFQNLNVRRQGDPSEFEGFFAFALT